MHPEESQDSIETLLRALVSKKGTTHSNDHAAEVVPEAIQGASRAETHREVTGVTAPQHRRHPQGAGYTPASGEAAHVLGSGRSCGDGLLVVDGVQVCGGDLVGEIVRMANIPHAAL